MTSSSEFLVVDIYLITVSDKMTTDVGDLAERNDCTGSLFCVGVLLLTVEAQRSLGSLSGARDGLLAYGFFLPQRRSELLK